MVNAIAQPAITGENGPHYSVIGEQKLISLCPSANYRGSHTHPSATAELQKPATAAFTVSRSIYHVNNHHIAAAADAFPGS